ncbi:hypothetical protein K490DRAFT_17689, partial [Saccharata proteae CBS 121410]
LHAAVSENPYSIAIRLDLAEAYRRAGYPDLTVGEAYKALLLVDEVLDESGEYHEVALEAAQADIGREWTDKRLEHAETEVEVEVDEASMWTETVWRDAAYAYVAGSLLMCGCLKSASEICDRGINANPSNAALLVIKDRLQLVLEAYMKERGWSLSDEDITIDDYPERGFVRRELYPWWSSHEPDRYSPESLTLLNQQLSAVAPQLEARVTELPLLATTTTSTSTSTTPPQTVKQLGVYAKTSIPPKTPILNETSLLTANSRLHDTFCDACSAALPPLTTSSPTTTVSCDSCSDTIFCSPTCHDLAQQSYHPALCDRDVAAIAKDAPATEAADALYSLLLLRALAMAVTQRRHPLRLPEVAYIWGDYHNTPLEAFRCDERGPTGDAFGGMPRTLPWTFSANVLTPLHMLEKMDVDIFAPENSNINHSTPDISNPWLFNALYARFRGTASARQGRDGKPDVGAVHPLWCLANHSCDPNVRWEWEGTMKFWVRGREERVFWGEEEGKGKKEGLKEGEEVLSHYCDIELGVRERREWAVGALGGFCMCERCIWEE